MSVFKSFDGVQLAYETVGDGPVVLLLHGFAADSAANWFRPRVVDALVAAGRRVVALDARGHGQSEKPHEPEAYADDAMVNDASALLDHLATGQVDVCGYSMGAMTTYALAGRDRRVRAAVLGGVGGGMGSSALARRAPKIAEGLLAEDPATVADPTARAFRAFADSTHADRRALAAIQNSRAVSPRQFTEVSVPTLVIVGDADTLVGSPHKLAERIPGAVVKIVSGDHLSAVFDPAFSQGIVDFLSDVDAHR